MTDARRGTFPLILVAGLVAVGAAAYVVLRSAPVPAMRHGTVAPDFSLPTLGGSAARLADQRGRVVFVNFWATWCAPCKEESPALQRLYRELEPEGFELLAVSIDSEADIDKIASFRDEFGLTFPIPLDPRRSAYSSFGAYGVPETFLIDPEGRLVERFVGPKNWDHPRYARAIRRILAARGEGAPAPEPGDG